MNPNYNPETREVNANFVFSVATGNTPTTKMTPANVQSDLGQAFRGIDNATLLAYKLGTANDGKHVAASSTAAEKEYDLGTVMTAGYLTNTAGSPQGESRRVLELSLPTETNALMFWGKAIKDGSDAQLGKIDWAVDKNIANNSFKLCQRIGDTAKQNEFQAVEKLIAEYLTALCEAGISTPTDYTYGGQTVTGVTMKWSDFATITTSGVTAKTTAPLDPSLPMSA
ncbi:MAG: hypothetical protein IJ636_07445, partial [Bacteroidales bacterium]|nr:hypothetical protein [Bacteroidales bacterium]